LKNNIYQTDTVIRNYQPVNETNLKQTTNFKVNNDPLEGSTQKSFKPQLMNDLSCFGTPIKLDPDKKIKQSLHSQEAEIKHFCIKEKIPKTCEQLALEEFFSNNLRPITLTYPIIKTHITERLTDCYLEQLEPNIVKGIEGVAYVITIASPHSTEKCWNVTTESKKDNSNFKFSILKKGILFETLNQIPFENKTLHSYFAEMFPYLFIRFKIRKKMMHYYTAILQQFILILIGPILRVLIWSAADAYVQKFGGRMVKMNVYCGWPAALFFCFVDEFQSSPLSLLFLSSPLLHLKLAGARADYFGLDSTVFLKRIGRDITFPKSPEALLPGAYEPSISSFSVPIEAYVEGESGLNADDEHLF
jgi:hypothetical protein